MSFQQIPQQATEQRKKVHKPLIAQTSFDETIELAKIAMSISYQMLEESQVDQERSIDQQSKNQPQSEEVPQPQINDKEDQLLSSSQVIPSLTEYAPNTTMIGSQQLLLCASNRVDSFNPISPYQLSSKFNQIAVKRAKERYEKDEDDLAYYNKIRDQYSRKNQLNGQRHVRCAHLTQQSGQPDQLVVKKLNQSKAITKTRPTMPIVRHLPMNQLVRLPSQQSDEGSTRDESQRGQHQTMPPPSSCQTNVLVQRKELVQKVIGQTNDLQLKNLIQSAFRPYSSQQASKKNLVLPIPEKKLIELAPQKAMLSKQLMDSIIIGKKIMQTTKK